MKTAWVTLAAGLAIGTAAHADVKVFDTSIAALGGGADASLRGPGAWGTGWESTEGWAASSVEPQMGWAASGVNLPFASVSPINPHAGTQHMRIVRDTTAAQGAQRLVLTPSQPAMAPGRSVTSMMVNISNYGGADYDIIGQAPSQGFLSWRVNFHFASGVDDDMPGHIHILDNPGSGLQFVDTGAEWAAGVYKELRVDMDPLADTMKYYYDGDLIYTGAAGVFAGTIVQQVVWRSDNFQLTGESGNFDDFSVAVPAPAGLAVLGLGGVAMLRRKRT